MTAAPPRDKTQPPPIRDLQKRILGTRHAFETCGFIATNFLSPLHRAIIFFLRQSRTGATEYQILDFLTQHWPEIVEITSQAPMPVPTIEFVRFCICVHRAHCFLFRRKEGGLISVYGDDPSDQMPRPVLITEPKPVPQSGPAQIRFEEEIWLLLKSHPYGLTEADLGYLLDNFRDVPGESSFLEYDTRIHACLVKLKIQERVARGGELGVWVPILN